MGELGRSIAVRLLRAVLGLPTLLLLVGTAYSQNLSFGSWKARPDPEWLPVSSIYELWLTAFSREGNLRGAIPGLGHIGELGATIVNLGPIAKRSEIPKASPYNIADYAEPVLSRNLHDFVTAAQSAAPESDDG